MFSKLKQPKQSKQSQQPPQSQQEMREVIPPTKAALKMIEFHKRTFAKRVQTPEDLSNWKRSLAYYDVIAYINNTSMAIQGYRQDGGNYIVSSQMMKLTKIFNWLDRLLYECHPLGVGHSLLRCAGKDKLAAMESSIALRRKCHHAYHHWYNLIKEKLFAILERQVAPKCRHINELAQYLKRSFGNRLNNTYGPANELMFVFYLCGLFKAGILTGEDTIAAVLVLFQRYLDMVRRLVSFYRLAPTYKSDHSTIHDQNVLPYIWGCAQLCRDEAFAPSQSDDPANMETYRPSYMLSSSLHYLQKSMGNRALGVHSYQLWSVLSLSNWPDAYTGLMDSYVKYVLNDFYIVRDLIFGEMMSFARQPLEYIWRAYLGEPAKRDLAAIQAQIAATDDSDGADSETEDEDESESESESESEAEADTEIDAEDEKKQPGPPVDLFTPPKSNVYLGFCDPSTFVPPDKEPHQGALLRPRQRKAWDDEMLPAGVAARRAQSSNLSNLSDDSDGNRDGQKPRPSKQRQSSKDEKVVRTAGESITTFKYS